MTKYMFISLICLTVGTGVIADPPSGNQEILTIASNMLGQNIGNKKCYSYVEAVLKESGTTIDTTCMVEEAQPGDVFLTYGFYRLKTKPSKYIVIDGIGSHIAIVKKNLGNDCYLILEQNEDGKGSAVSERIINLKTYGTIYSLGYAFVRPKKGKYTHTAYRLVRGDSQFETTNDILVDRLH